MKITIIYLFAVISLLTTINSSYSQITLSVAGYTAGTCISDGTVTLNTTGGTAPYQYRILSGPTGITYPTAWQNTTTFNSLVAGNYQFEAIDASVPSLKDTISQTVTTSYAVMNVLAATFGIDHTGSCATRRVNGRVQGGKGPFLFELLQGGVPMYSLPNVPKAGTTVGTFLNVAAGTYILRITDACGEIRTQPDVIVASIDYKWSSITGNPGASDNFVTDRGSVSSPLPLPFDQTKIPNARRNDPYLFTCDSIAFRLSASLTPSAPAILMRRFFVRNLNTGVIDFDITYNLSIERPSIRLAINTPYRFYFDDLCNDIDSLDRNYNYSTGANFTITNSVARNGCGAYSMALSKPVNWNFANRYSTAIDTVTIISSSLVGDTMVGKRIIYNWTDASLNSTNVDANLFRFYGVTPGTTYTVRVQNKCHNYTLTTTLGGVPKYYIAQSEGYGAACLLNTSAANFRSLNLPVDVNGFVKYYITSGPTTFTDSKGYTSAITYPIIDSVQYLNGVSVGTAGNDFLRFRNFPQGTYSVYGINQCSETSATINFTINNPTLLKFDATINEVNKCGANNFRVAMNVGTAKNHSGGITFSREFWNGSSWVSQVNKQNASSFLENVPVNTVLSENTTYHHSFTGVTGRYRFSIFPSGYGDVTGNIKKGPVPYCDTLWTQVIDLVGYQNPQISSLSAGYVCSTGGSDGIANVVGTQGVPAYTFQQLDNSNNVLLSQNNGHFAGLSQGTYKFRIIDDCGNGIIKTIEIKDLVNPTILKGGVFCVNENTLVLSRPVANGATYSWSGPNGFITTNDTLRFNPLSLSDSGAYILTQTIPNCIQPKSVAFNISVCDPLPIELINFSASCENGAMLHWATATETNVNRFEILRTENGKEWSLIGTIPAKGHSSTKQTYQFADRNGFGEVYYRLRSVDNNGDEEVFNPISLNCTNTFTEWNVFPVPTSNKLTINLLATSEQFSSLEVFDLEGRLVLQKNIEIINGVNQFEINVENLASNVYFISIANDKQFAPLKFVKVD